MVNLNLFVLTITIIHFLQAVFLSPILEIEDENQGYLGIIDEHSRIASLEPRLRIKNKEEISKI